MDSVSLRLALFLSVLLSGCGGVTDDLLPSGADRRTAVTCGVIGPEVCQNAPDFTLTDTLGNTITLSSVLPGADGVVLYFTMWCPVCDTHMSKLRSQFLPNYPGIRFFLVDYVSGSVALARSAETSAGYAGSGMTTLVDSRQAVLGLYRATMGATVVIDRFGAVRMNEDFKDGARLQGVLVALP